jgi:hypothetical protein
VTGSVLHLSSVLNLGDLHADATWLKLGAMIVTSGGISSDWWSAKSTDDPHRVSVDDCLHDLCAR